MNRNTIVGSAFNPEETHESILARIAAGRARKATIDRSRLVDACRQFAEDAKSPPAVLWLDTNGDAGSRRAPFVDSTEAIVLVCLGGAEISPAEAEALADWLLQENDGEVRECLAQAFENDHDAICEAMAEFQENVQKVFTDLAEGTPAEGKEIPPCSWGGMAIRQAAEEALDMVLEIELERARKRA